MLRSTFRKPSLVAIAIAVALFAVAVGAGGCRGVNSSDQLQMIKDPCSGYRQNEEAACDPCSERPPCAKPGEAWCRVWVPPAYGTEYEKVLVKPPCERRIMIPPRFGTRPRIVCCDDAQLNERCVPAVWGVKKQEYEVCPEREYWQRICCPPTNDLGECEVQGECWTKKVCPPVTCERESPVCLAPERRCVSYTPAQYKVVEESFLIDPARCEVVCDPAVYETRCKQVCIKAGHWEWRRNEACEVPCTPCPRPMPRPCAPPPAPKKPEALAALQVEMQDNAPSGEKAGMFAQGDVVRYDLKILTDEGSKALQGLHVVFTLPPELEFISGDGQGVTVTGGGQSAKTAPFDIAIGTSRTMHILCRVLSVPPTNLVQLEASVRDAEGFELATETESSTLKPAR